MPRLTEYAGIARLVFGGVRVLGTGCECFDFDDDGDVDLADFAEFQVSFTG